MNKDKRDQLREFRVPLDKEALWAELEARQKRKKRRWFFWMFPALLLVVGLLMWTLNIEQPSVPTESQLIKTAERATDYTNNSNNQKNETNNTNNTNNNVPDNKSISSSALAHQKKEQVSTESKLVAPIQQKESTLRAQQQQNTDRPNQIKTNRLTKKNTTTQKAYQKESSTFTLDKKVDDKRIVSSIIEQNVTTTKNILADIPPIAPASPQKNTNLVAPPLAWLQSLTPSLTSEQVSILRTPQLSLEYDELEAAKQSFHKAKPFVELYSGVGIVSRELSDPTGDNTSYAAIRANTESPLESVHLGLNYGRYVAGNIYLTAGLELGQITERFSFLEATNEYRDEMDNVVTELFINAVGDSTQVSQGIAQGTTREFVQYEIYNRLRTVDVPLGLGWRTKKGKWSLGIEAGAQINLAFAFKGTILDANLERTNEPSWYKNRIGVSWKGSMDIGYSINDNFTLVLRPSFKLIPNLIDKNMSALEQSYKVYNIGLGLRYQLK